MSGDGAGEDAPDRIEAGRLRTAVTLEEFRRRNVGAVSVDVVYLFTTAFFATLAARGVWPAVIAAGPLATVLYFAWRSSRPFFVANLVVIALTVAATRAGVLPL